MFLTPILASLLCLSVVADEPAKKIEAPARAFFEAVQKGDFDKAVRDFDATMKEKMPADKLGEFWKALTMQVGPLKKEVEFRTQKVGKSDAAVFACEFEKTKLDLRLIFDADNKIAGFQLLPSTQGLKFDPPPYAKPDTFGEKEVTVGAGKWAVPGTLTLPKGDGPFPVVVLVHGSGPHDRDETTGPNKPLRDVAWGLASQGIAVLRYVKRTEAHGTEMLKQKDSITIDEETVDDAVAAVELLTKTDKIDRKKIFVLGHSLGGYAAPRIAERSKDLAGIVIMAGNARPLEDLILEQFTYIFSLSGGPTEEQKKELEKLKVQVAKVKEPKLSPDTPAKELPLGQPAAYWLSLRAYDQTGTAAKLSRPVLVLQGGRDYQVTMADFDGWKQALAKKTDATFKSYANLNHLFAAGEGKATPAEYLKAGFVDKAVIDDVAEWVKRN